MKLGFIEKFLPPDNKVFFDCFSDAAMNCKQTAILYNDLLQNGADEEKVMKAKLLKHKGNDLEKDTIAKLNNTFVTPIDREDIQMLAALLRKINKKIYQAFTNYYVYKIDSPTKEMIEQAKILLKATTELTRSVSLMKKIYKTKEITASRRNLKEIETLGDDILLKATEELFSGKFDPITVIKYRDIYEDVESALDRCHSVADEILTIALKNS